MTTKKYSHQEEMEQVLNEPTVTYQRTDSSDFRITHSAYAEKPFEGNALLNEYKANDPHWEDMFRPCTMEQINRRIDEAEANIAAGNTMSGEEFFAELKKDFPWLY